MKLLSKVLLCSMLLSMLLVMPGCSWWGKRDDGNDLPDDQGDGPEAFLEEYANLNGEGSYYRPVRLTDAMSEWVDNAAHHIFLGQSRIFGDYLYILVTYGPKPTGGYTVQVTDVLVEAAEVIVSVDFSEPRAGEAVTQAITYPYDLVAVPAADLPVRFIAGGAESYVMALYGIDTLETIVASSNPIKLFEPADGSDTNGALRFRGVASVFEGQIDYRLLDAAGGVIAEGYTMAGMGDWYYFEETIGTGDFTGEVTEATLELFTISPKDGSEQDLVSVKVNIIP
ncbi:MAG: Gmad2 immunoglobulin-like domain-containing protein [Bacillota bacterium]